MEPVSNLFLVQWLFVELFFQPRFDNINEAFCEYFLTKNPVVGWSAKSLMKKFEYEILPSMHECDADFWMILSIYHLLKRKVSREVKTFLESKFDIRIMLKKGIVHGVYVKNNEELMEMPRSEAKEEYKHPDNFPFDVTLSKEFEESMWRFIENLISKSSEGSEAHRNIDILKKEVWIKFIEDDDNIQVKSASLLHNTWLYVLMPKIGFRTMDDHTKLQVLQKMGQKLSPCEISHFFQKQYEINVDLSGRILNYEKVEKMKERTSEGNTGKVHNTGGKRKYKAHRDIHRKYSEREVAIIWSNVEVLVEEMQCGNLTPYSADGEQFWVTYKTQVNCLRNAGALKQFYTKNMKQNLHVQPMPIRRMMQLYRTLSIKMDDTVKTILEQTHGIIIKLDGSGIPLSFKKMKQ